MKGYLVIHPDDNVGIALKLLPKGTVIQYNSHDIMMLEDIGFGHKFALTDISDGSNILKYGLSIGNASHFISKGAHVHLHNLQSDYK